MRCKGMASERGWKAPFRPGAQNTLGLPQAGPRGPLEPFQGIITSGARMPPDMFASDACSRRIFTSWAGTAIMVVIGRLEACRCRSSGLAPRITPSTAGPAAPDRLDAMST